MLYKRSTTEFSALPRMTTSDVIMPSNRRVKTWDEIIYIPEGVEQYVLNDVKLAGVSTSTIKCCDDALIVDGGATSTLTKSLRTVLKSDQKWQQYRQLVARRLYILPTSVSRHTLSGIELVQSDQLL